MTEDEVQVHFDRSIAVDFDDTIVVRVFGTLVPAKDCIEALQILRDQGYRIIIHSARSWEQWQDRIERENEMVNLLNQWEIPYDEVYAGKGKPPAMAYIDDRGLRFADNWMDIARVIIEKGRV
jgi:hypothetical protein